ncbi:MAG TPA: hypothetical protein D7H95_04660 [Candidatus Poseidoniales archaeon]|nr:MAG TPA: hypothetical protein D7H95_04660 [Candidatus Poseidoniales archaeon]
MPRRKYGRLRKAVELPSKENCSRCRSGKFCPLEGHSGQDVVPKRAWAGPAAVAKRKAKRK